MILKINYFYPFHSYFLKTIIQMKSIGNCFIQKMIDISFGQEIEIFYSPFVLCCPVQKECLPFPSLIPLLYCKLCVSIFIRLIFYQYSFHSLTKIGIKMGKLFLKKWEAQINTQKLKLYFSVIWCYLYSLFTYIYSLLIEKDLSECWKISASVGKYHLSFCMFICASLPDVSSFVQ